MDAWKQREGRREIRMTEGTEGTKGIEKEQKEERGNGRERRKLREGRILRRVYGIVVQQWKGLKK